MEAVAIELDPISAIIETSTAQFAEVYVKLTKLEHVQQEIEARNFKSPHQRRQFFKRPFFLKSPGVAPAGPLMCSLDSAATRRMSTAALNCVIRTCCVWVFSCDEAAKPAERWPCEARTQLIPAALGARSPEQ